MTFIVFALPRSRTAWTATYLNYRNNFAVGHDEAVHCSTSDEFLAKLETEYLTGTVETAGMLGWRLIRARLPDARFAVISRRTWEVERSLGQFGIIPRRGELEERNRMLMEIAAHPGVLCIYYDELMLPEYRKRLFEHCLQRPWDEAWDREMAWRNIQIDVHTRMKYLADNQARIEALKASLAA